MKLAHYWARHILNASDKYGQPLRLAARGWSDSSREEALERAASVASQLATRFAHDDVAARKYLYGERPLAEPILWESRAADSSVAAAITRNVYGATVLNVQSLMFVDIDKDDSAETAPAAPAIDATAITPAGLLDGLMSLFGSQPATMPQTPQQPAPRRAATLDRIVATASTLGLRVRAYKTAAGYRLLVVNAPFVPGSQESEGILKRFDSDPMYIHLCRMQQSFRARLSPKPWRCGQRKPPGTFPYETPRDQASFHAWLEGYDAAAARYATCRFVGEFGDAAPDAALAPLVTLHDQHTRAGVALPLA